MTKATHTPGPWRQGERNPEGVYAMGSPTPIAEANTSADARLIAAAPEMLSALEWWQAQMYDDSCDDLGKLLDQMSAKAHHAIKKAKGA